MRVFSTFEELTAAVGEDLGSSDWLEGTQERVNAFANATGDHQWIHVDVQRAAEGPFGTTIAHGYLTLALIPQFGAQIFALDTPGAKLNYGVNKVRFPAPVPVGSRIRASASVAAVTDLPLGKQLLMRFVVEVENREKPACVAETVALLLPCVRGPAGSGGGNPVDDDGRGFVRAGVRPLAAVLERGQCAVEAV